MTKYLEIYLYIKTNIDEKVFPTGSKIPTEAELADQFGCSRGTIKKAIDILKQERYIKQIKGSGTFVIDDYHRISEFQIESQVLGFTKTHSGKKTHSTVDMFEIIECDKEIAQKLEINIGDYVYHYTRSRYVNDIPYTIEYTYMPVALIPNFKKQILEGSVFDYLINTLHLSFGDTHRVVTARIPTEHEVEFYNHKQDLVILNYEQVSFLADGRPFEYTNIAQDGSITSARMVINKVEQFK